MKTHCRSLGVLSPLLLLAASGCVGPPGSVAPDDVGSLSASLQLSPGTTLNTANYAISGPNAFARAGSIDVSHSQTISATIGGIPAGDGFNVTITGTASDGLTVCSGSATFSITPKVTTIVSIKIQCREPAKTGGVLITGTVNICPVVDAVGANPGEVMVGFSSAISSSAHDSDGKPAALTYSWAATSGMLAGATTANPTLFCTAAGVSTLTLTVSDGDCTDTGSVTVICSPAPAAPALVRINEVESSGGTPGDWVELTNVGGTTADISGWIFKDNDDTHIGVIPAGTTLAPGAYYVLNELIGGAGQFNFGLGGGDSARLFDPTGVVIDSFTWATAAAITYGRCPNGTGGFVNTASSTKGAANDCGGGMGTGGAAGGGMAGTTGTGGTTGAGTTGAAGTTGNAGTSGGGATGTGGLALLPWPSDDAVVTVDGVNQFASNLSGLSYQSGAGTDSPVLWAVQNSPSLLHRLVFDGTTWVGTPTDEWPAGKTLRYTNGAGGPDSEGVTRAELGSSAIYVAAERDNNNNGVSRLSVLRYDTDAPGAELIATNEWNLTADLPAVGSNLGLEAITWIPDSYLVANGFTDESAAAAYDPNRYPGHGTGLFFVGVEASGNVYGYALDHTGGAFQRIASLSSGQPAVMDLAFDRDVGQLWAYCDNTCGNRTALLGVAGGRLQVRRLLDHPATLPDSNNEGIAFASEADCAAGRKAFFWADDGNFGGHALRRGTISCGSLL